MRFYFFGFLFLSNVCLGMLVNSSPMKTLDFADTVQNITRCLFDIEDNISKIKDFQICSSKGSARIGDRPSQVSLFAEANISMDFNQIEDYMNDIKDVDPQFGRDIEDFLWNNSPTYGASLDLDNFKVAKDSFFKKFLKIK